MYSNITIAGFIPRFVNIWPNISTFDNGVFLERNFRDNKFLLVVSSSNLEKKAYIGQKLKNPQNYVYKERLSQTLDQRQLFLPFPLPHPRMLP